MLSCFKCPWGLAGGSRNTILSTESRNGSQEEERELGQTIAPATCLPELGRVGVGRSCKNLGEEAGLAAQKREGEKQMVPHWKKFRKTAHITFVLWGPMTRCSASGSEILFPL